jgi:chromosome segregation ATPase
MELLGIVESLGWSHVVIGAASVIGTLGGQWMKNRGKSRDLLWEQLVLTSKRVSDLEAELRLLRVERDALSGENNELRLRLQANESDICDLQSEVNTLHLKNNEPPKYYDKSGKPK